MINNLNNLITTLSDKYSLDIHTDLQEDLLIGDIRITEQGRVILREKSIDLFHMRGVEFFDFLQGTEQEERRILTDLSCLVRIEKREFQECTGRYVDEREIDYEEEYCRLRLEFNRYVESKKEEGGN